MAPRGLGCSVMIGQHGWRRELHVVSLPLFTFVGVSHLTLRGFEIISMAALWLLLLGSSHANLTACGSSLTPTRI